MIETHANNNKIINISTKITFFIISPFLFYYLDNFFFNFICLFIKKIEKVTTNIIVVIIIPNDTILFVELSAAPVA